MDDTRDQGALVPVRERSDAQAVGRLSGVTEFLGTLIDSLKDVKLVEQVATASTWLGAIGGALQEALPPLKGLATLAKRLTEKNDPEQVGFVACSRAFESAVAHALHRVGPPSDFRAWTESMRSGLDSLVPGTDITFSDFTFEAADSHPFVVEALRLLDGFASAIGYTESDRRRIQTLASRRFCSSLKTILSDRKTRNEFQPFADRIALGSAEQNAAMLLEAHAEFLRSQFHERQVLDHEPFALADVYVDPQCSEFTWGELRSQQRIDPFDARTTERHEILERVIAKLGDGSFDDAIVIQGVAGAGKSAFTLRLCMKLLEEGLQPIRIRLRDLNLDRHVREALPAALRLPLAGRIEGRLAPESSGDIFRGGRVFERGVRFGMATIAPVVLILDGWDELSVTASTPFKDRLERFLEQLRAEYLGDGRHPFIRVIVTGRPSMAFTASRFLREKTLICTLLPFLPARVEQFMQSVARALQLRRLAAQQWQPWSLADAQIDELTNRYASRFVELMEGERGLAPSHVLDVLGLPLLAFITIRLVAEWPNGLAVLVQNPTVLMRSLVDLTCLKSGQVSTESMDLSDRARVSGMPLRHLLRRSAVAISVRGEESITFDELSRRIRDVDLDAVATAATAPHPLSELLVSYFFKGGHKELGCEFVHKSFREYLFAEEIVEQLKLYGRTASARLPRRELYWQEFDEADPRFGLSRAIASLTGPRWLAPEVTAHVLALLDWELTRTDGIPRPGPMQAMATERLDRDGWRKVRDGLADLWEWWGEGVHLRSQEQRESARAELHLSPPFVQCVIEGYLDSPPAPTLVVAPRTAAIDAQLGDALFRLSAFVHFRVATADGWAGANAPQDDQEGEPTETWEVRSPTQSELWWREAQAAYDMIRPCQVRTSSGHVLFSPAGRRPEYFANFTSRINGGGNRPDGPFPGGVDASGADLRRVTLASLGDSVSPAKWEFANISHAKLVGSFARNDFSRVVATNLRALSADLNGALFVDALLRNSSLDGAVLENASFEGATLINTSFTGSSLDGVIFHSADIVSLGFVRASMRGVDVRSAALRDVHFADVDLSNSDFQDASLVNVAFQRANLFSTDLRGALENVSFDDSAIAEAKFPAECGVIDGRRSQLSLQVTTTKAAQPG
jgi:uncharacterized protein YjbI with pentapeptide repeats